MHEAGPIARTVTRGVTHDTFIDWLFGPNAPVNASR
jgi:hypothetical protein